MGREQLQSENWLTKTDLKKTFLKQNLALGKRFSWRKVLRVQINLTMAFKGLILAKVEPTGDYRRYDT